MIVPKQIDIETSAVCQLRCKGCPINYASKGAYMDRNLWHSIVDRVCRERREDWNPTIVNWLNGEPLLHPDYYEFCERLSRENLRYYITTNGHIWNEELFNLIVQPNSCYQIIWSLDGLPDERSRSIEKARPGSNRELVLKNISRFLDLAQSTGGFIDVAVKLCHRGQDYEEVEEYIQYWLHRGVDYVCIGDMLDEDTVDDMRIYPCKYSDTMFMVIKYDGDIVPCSYNNAATNDRWFNKHAGWPNVRNDTPLLELYNSPEMTKFRENQRRGIFAGPCKACGFAYTGSGIRGKVTFRGSGLEVSYHRDYYNQFFSLREEHQKPDSFYD